jgi:hypothetical protein
MNLPALVVSLSMILVTLVAGQVPDAGVSPQEPRWKQLAQGYGFLLGQQNNLKRIEKDFPDLAGDVKQAWFAFQSCALGESLPGVEAELGVLLGENWPAAKERMAAENVAMINGQKVSRAQAVGFLAEVRARAKGQLPENIRTALLSAHPRYAKNSAAELSEGWKQTFRTKDHPKAKGLDFAISLPASWSKREGNRPNIIQFFQSGGGHGPLMCAIMAKTFPLPPGSQLTRKELEEFFRPEELKDLVPEKATFVSAKPLVLEGMPAGLLIADQAAQRLDLSVTLRLVQFITIRDSSIIFIQFSFAKSPTQSLDDLQQQVLPTCLLIANSFIYFPRYQ